MPMAPAPDPDAELMLRVRRGDDAAFEVLVQKYKQPILNLVFRTLPDPAEAEDLAQSVFVQAYKSAHRYRATAKFSTWLFTIARNLCLNEIRRRTRHPTESIESPHPEPADEPPRQFRDERSSHPGDACLHAELQRNIEVALRELPENQRLAILLCREEELSYEDISAVLGCSLSATKSLIHRGRETLRLKLKEYLRSGAWDAEKS
jgi:RNA polymerase sigma-70 factor (ECF subfamily)